MRKPKTILVFIVIALALALRIAHLSSAMLSPLTYQPKPDEDYYQRFGIAVASGGGALAAEFTFMDPGFGYLLGAVFRIVGVNLFAVPSAPDSGSRKSRWALPPDNGATSRRSSRAPRCSARCRYGWAVARRRRRCAGTTSSGAI